MLESIFAKPAEIEEYISKMENMDIKAILNALNKKSGYTGVYGGSSDARDLRDAQEAGDERADLVIQMQNKGICDYIISCF